MADAEDMDSRYDPEKPCSEKNEPHTYPAGFSDLQLNGHQGC